MGRSRKIIFGAGGVAREVAWMLSEVVPDEPVSAFAVPDRDRAEPQAIDCVEVVAESAVLSLFTGPIEAFLAIGSPAIRRAVYSKLQSESRYAFPSLIHPSTNMDRRDGKTLIDEGAIVYPRASLTTGVSLGAFVQVNPCATIGHGARIGRFTTVCPGSNISGEATIGEGCFIGAGAVIKEGIRIADGCLIGAGAVVICDIFETGTWVGVPARRRNP